MNEVFYGYQSVGALGAYSSTVRCVWCYGAKLSHELKIPADVYAGRTMANVRR